MIKLLKLSITAWLSRKTEIYDLREQTMMTVSNSLSSAFVDDGKFVIATWKVLQLYAEDSGLIHYIPILQLFDDKLVSDLSV